jgi:histidine triad (HIT) family protein
MIDCPFCPMPEQAQELTPAVAMFTPLDPVVPGHLLFVPYAHVEDFTTAPMLFAAVAQCAAEWAKRHEGDWNLITSKGVWATQSVRHLHVHLIPRHEGDGLNLPWTDQVRRRNGLSMEKIN